jgi:ATP-dependent Lhr-like helicase
MDALEREELTRERVRQLLQRYGVLFRDLLYRELPDFRWKAVFRSLRIMELGGEVLTGHFFEDVPGLQFASPAAYRMLKGGVDEESIYWMNAADPACLSGIPHAELRPGYPDRLRTTWIVFRGGAPALIMRKNGLELDFLVEPSDPGIPEMLRVFRMLLTRDWHPLTAVKVQLVNGEPPEQSAYRRHLIESGFREEYKGYTLWAL